MKPELKKLLILNAPYLLFVYLFDKIGQAVRLAPGADLSGKVLSLADGFSAAFATPLPSLAPMDLLIGIVGAVLIRLMVYFKGKNAKKYRKGIVPSVPMKGLTADENIKIITALIVSDEIYSEFVNSDTCMVYWNFCIPNELVETKGLMLPIMEARDLLKPSGLYYESYLNNFGRQLFYVISGSYTTLYMGFMFLIIACALLALQFLTQMQTTKSRYLTLSILGARREQIKRSINQQVLWYFLLPLILACISGAVGIYAMQLYLYSGAAHLEQSYPLLIAMAVIVVLVMVIYGVAVARTANREIGKLNYKPNS